MCQEAEEPLHCVCVSVAVKVSIAAADSIVLLYWICSNSSVNI